MRYLSQLFSVCFSLSFFFFFSSFISRTVTALAAESRARCGQSDGAEVHRRRVRRQHQTHTVLMSHPEDAPDSAGKRHHCRIHQERRLQVWSSVLCGDVDLMFAVCVLYRDLLWHWASWHLNIIHSHWELIHTGLRRNGRRALKQTWKEIMITTSHVNI